MYECVVSFWIRIKVNNGFFWFKIFYKDVYKYIMSKKSVLLKYVVIVLLGFDVLYFFGLMMLMMVLLVVW